MSHAGKHGQDGDGRTNAGSAIDLFICHASEDKDDFVRPLANALIEARATVWYDEHTIQLGDSLRQRIDEGLANCRYGVVVLSPSFFEKRWPQHELDGLFTRELAEGKVILPIWHRVNEEIVRQHSPILASKYAAKSADGVKKCVDEILAVLRTGGRQGDRPTTSPGARAANPPAPAPPPPRRRPGPPQGPGVHVNER